MMSRMQAFPNNTDIIIINNQQHHENLSSSSSSSSHISNLSPSILTIALILIITLIATVSLILLIRRSGCLPICNNQTSSFSTSSSISSHHRVSPHLLIDSLPLFSFSAVSTLAGDCSVCLSKFQPHDQLRLLPLCLHAFHAQCVDSWLRLNLTCPLCRSTVIVPDLAGGSHRSSFRLEIGDSSVSSGRRRSYSMGSFDYVVEGDQSEVSVSDGSGKALPSTPPEVRLAADVAEERSWLRECMDRVAETVSSRTLSFRSSGRFFTGSSRRSNVGEAAELNLEAGSIGDEISELFRWASGV